VVGIRRPIRRQDHAEPSVRAPALKGSDAMGCRNSMPASHQASGAVRAQGLHAMRRRLLLGRPIVLVAVDAIDLRPRHRPEAVLARMVGNRHCELADVVLVV
jgi:hypothetical protein